MNGSRFAERSASRPDTPLSRLAVASATTLDNAHGTHRCQEDLREVERDDRVEHLAAGVGQEADEAKHSHVATDARLCRRGVPSSSGAQTCPWGERYRIRPRGSQLGGRDLLASRGSARRSASEVRRGRR